MMRLPRTSIAALMGIIILLAVVFAALARPTPLWAAVMFSGVMVALTFAVVAALFSKGMRRAFWSGFLVGGASYLLLHYGPYCSEHVGPYTLPTAVLDIVYETLHEEPADVVQSSSFDLPTAVPTSPAVVGEPAPPPAAGRQDLALVPASQPLEAVLTNPQPFQLGTIQMTGVSRGAWVDWTSMNSGQGLVSPNTMPEFYRIGHAFFGLLAALTFGFVARRVAERNEPTKRDLSSHGSEAPATLGA